MRQPSYRQSGRLDTLLLRLSSELDRDPANLIERRSPEPREVSSEIARADVCRVNVFTGKEAAA